LAHFLLSSTKNDSLDEGGARCSETSEGAQASTGISAATGVEVAEASMQASLDSAASADGPTEDDGLSGSELDFLGEPADSLASNTGMTGMLRVRSLQNLQSLPALGKSMDPMNIEGAVILSPRALRARQKTLEPRVSPRAAAAEEDALGDVASREFSKEDPLVQMVELPPSSASDEGGSTAAGTAGRATMVPSQGFASMKFSFQSEIQTHLTKFDTKLDDWGPRQQKQRQRSGSVELNLMPVANLNRNRTHDVAFGRNAPPRRARGQLPDQIWMEIRAAAFDTTIDVVQSYVGQQRGLIVPELARDVAHFYVSPPADSMQQVSAILQRITDAKELFQSESEFFASCCRVAIDFDGRVNTLESWHLLSTALQQFSSGAVALIPKKSSENKLPSLPSSRLTKQRRNFATKWVTRSIDSMEQVHKHHAEFRRLGLSEINVGGAMHLLIQLVNNLVLEVQAEHVAATLEHLKRILAYAAKVDWNASTIDTTVYHRWFRKHEPDVLLSFKNYFVMLNKVGGPARPEVRPEAWLQREQGKIARKRRTALEQEWKFAQQIGQDLGKQVSGTGISGTWSGIIVVGFLDLALQVLRDAGQIAEQLSESVMESNLSAASEFLHGDISLCRRICDLAVVAATYRLSDPQKLFQCLRASKHRYIRVQLGQPKGSKDGENSADTLQKPTSGGTPRTSAGTAPSSFFADLNARVLGGANGTGVLIQPARMPTTRVDRLGNVVPVTEGATSPQANASPTRRVDVARLRAAAAAQAAVAGAAALQGDLGLGNVLPVGEDAGTANTTPTQRFDRLGNMLPMGREAAATWMSTTQSSTAPLHDGHTSTRSMVSSRGMVADEAKPEIECLADSSGGKQSRTRRIFSRKKDKPSKSGEPTSPIPEEPPGSRTSIERMSIERSSKDLPRLSDSPLTLTRQPIDIASTLTLTATQSTPDTPMHDRQINALFKMNDARSSWSPESAERALSGDLAGEPAVEPSVSKSTSSRRKAVSSHPDVDRSVVRQLSQPRQRKLSLDSSMTSNQLLVLFPEEVEMTHERAANVIRFLGNPINNGEHQVSNYALILDLTSFSEASQALMLDGMEAITGESVHVDVDSIDLGLFNVPPSCFKLVAPDPFTLHQHRNTFENIIDEVVPQSCYLVKSRAVLHQLVEDKIDMINSRALRVTHQLLHRAEAAALESLQQQLELDEAGIVLALRYVAEVSRLHIGYDQYLRLAAHSYKVTELYGGGSQPDLGGAVPGRLKGAKGTKQSAADDHTLGIPIDSPSEQGQQPTSSPEISYDSFVESVTSVESSSAADTEKDDGTIVRSSPFVRRRAERSWSTMTDPLAKREKQLFLDNRIGRVLDNGKDNNGQQGDESVVLASGSNRHAW
jgi:hypothetical protein